MKNFPKICVVGIISAVLIVFASMGCGSKGGTKIMMPGTGTGTGTGTDTGTGTATMSFATDIVPIFAAKGCTACHGTSGGLTLTGTNQEIYDELTVENPARVNTGTPDQSLVLTAPLVGQPGSCDKVFTDTSDADYQKILQWITEGAQNN
ncbi:MAG: hypothetical protein E3J72_09420 [Planctomycetota bacterium]|nr:MAG: hypothetical protein E3J72_09420 [Planctomycetota bacterium]